MKKKAIFTLCIILSTFAFSQQPQTKKPLMKFLGAYDAGQEGVNIYKMFDPTEEVVCYVLMPEVAGRRVNENGKIIYDGNTVGSLSCLKVRIEANIQAEPSAKQRKK